MTSQEIDIKLNQMLGRKCSKADWKKWHNRAEYLTMQERNMKLKRRRNANK